MSLRNMRMLFQRHLVKLGVLMILGVASASASVLGIFGGVDNGAGPGGPFTNSSAAEASFWTALGVSAPTITFEGVSSLGSLGSGASAVITNADPLSGLQTVNEHTPEPVGFNITTGGDEWLRIVPTFNSSTGATVTFSFSSAINAFGVWFTDTQTDFPGPITISFNDGAPEVLSVPKNGADATGAFTGGTVYYGFIASSPFTSVSINTGATTADRDAWGLDNITFGTAAVDTPEPSTLSLLVCAAIVAISLKLRGKSQHYALRINRTTVSERSRG